MENILNRSRFTEHLIKLNNLEFKKWIFETGMLFSSEMQWWGEKGNRWRRHNGLDLRFYETTDGTISTIDRGTKVPIIYDGKILRVIRDFLGYTVFAIHEIYYEGSQLFTIYGHTVKSPDVSVGEPLREGAMIATLAGPSNKRVPGHLHISVALVPGSTSAEDLTWELLDSNEDVRFLDPQLFI